VPQRAGKKTQAYGVRQSKQGKAQARKTKGKGRPDEKSRKAGAKSSLGAAAEGARSLPSEEGCRRWGKSRREGHDVTLQTTCRLRGRPRFHAAYFTPIKNNCRFGLASVPRKLLKPCACRVIQQNVLGQAVTSLRGSGTSG